ncbi:MAG: hypothetical protein KDC88_14000, partial [Ignavibacteriae bacterium]|nr:hypothetical protein [Ignavibacteriota bacterium]
VISLTNSAGNLVFQNNIFEGYDSNFLINNFQAIVFGDDSGSLDNISFVSNIFNYGFFSIMLFPTYGYNLQINNNTFNCNYAGGIFLQSFINTNINGNIATFNNVQILYNTFIKLSNNEIINNSGEGLLLFECYGNTSNFNKITNNIIQTGGTGIRLENCEYLEIYFNTINISNDPLTALTNSAAVQLVSGNSRIKLENNILMNKRDGYAYSGEIGFQNTNDFNNLFSSGSNLAKWEGSDYSTLTEFKTASSTNQNSYSTDIQFNSISDLHLKNSPVQLLGTTISGITTDIDGDTRNSPPFIGADEPETMQVSLTVLLEGPYSGTGNMSTSINGSLPLLHPYNSSIHDGTESVPLDFFTSHTDIIDWIAVELRSDISTKVSSRVGFLLANGEIVDIDGISPLIFYVDPSLNYHALIYHRNHLPVISSGFVN